MLAQGASGRSRRIRVLVVDDHPIVRGGLRALLGAEPDIEVVAEADDSISAVEAAVAQRPDVVLLDIRLPGVNGVQVCRRLLRACPTARVLVLTVSDAESDLYDAIKAGASGYLLKSVPVEEVVSAIRAVHGGQSLVGSTLAAKLLTPAPAPGRASEPASRLTRRELEVLRLVARGMNNREIASTLYISENTVKNHVRSILDKLGLKSRMEAVVYAVRERLVEIT